MRARDAEPQKATAPGLLPGTPDAITERNGDGRIMVADIAGVKAIVDDGELVVPCSTARVEFTLGCARRALVRARNASPSNPTDWPAEAIRDAQTTLRQIDTVGDPEARACMADYEAECGAITVEAIILCGMRTVSA